MAVYLISKLTSRSLHNSDKQHMLSRVAGLTCDAAAAAALQIEKAPSAALKLLEQGRGVLAASLEEMRTDILDLQGRHPELADKFVRLRDELERPITRNISFIDKDRMSPLQAGASRRYDVGKELDELIDEIRKRPGFEDFLLPPNERQVQAATECGPLVVINASEHRCDVLLVE